MDIDTEDFYDGSGESRDWIDEDEQTHNPKSPSPGPAPVYLQERPEDIPQPSIESPSQNFIEDTRASHESTALSDTKLEIKQKIQSPVPKSEKIDADNSPLQEIVGMTQGSPDSAYLTTKNSSPAHKHSTSPVSPEDIFTIEDEEQIEDDAHTENFYVPEYTPDNTKSHVFEISDDEDDLTIIDVHEASHEAQEKWKSCSSKRHGSLSRDSDHTIKKEPTTGSRMNLTPIPVSKTSKKTLTPEELLAATKKRVDERISIQNASRNESHSRLGAKLTTWAKETQARQERENAVARKIATISSQSSSGPSQPKKRALETSTLVDDRENFAKAANSSGNDEDISWMNEMPEDDGEFDSLTLLCQGLMKQRDSGNISFVDTAKLYRAQQRLKQLQRSIDSRKSAPESEDDEESMFLDPEPRSEVLKRHTQRRPVPRDSSVTSWDGDLDNQNQNENAAPSQGDTQIQEQQGEDDELFMAMLDEATSLKNNDGMAEKSKKTKQQKPVAKSAREGSARKQEKLAEKTRAKERKKLQKAKAKGKGPQVSKKSTKRNSKASAKGKAKQSESGSGNSGSQARPKQSWNNMSNGQDKVGQMILDNLMRTDPIAERMNGNTSNEFQTEGDRLKVTRLMKLFANVPEEMDKRTIRGDQLKLQQASKAFGYAKVRQVDRKWLVKGMTTLLYNHQLLGANWMLERELSENPPHGGLLADTMGLGKTVQTIACMIGNQPTEQDKQRRTKATLIVGPASILDQWIEEIKRHTDPKTFPKIVKYTKRSHLTANVLEDVDIVVTSYHEVMSQFPYPDKEERELMGDTIDHPNVNWEQKMRDSLGVLHQIGWYRVVLDEAHAIKNNAARTSLACQNLKSCYRWCLTGTPLLNRLEELFPYLRFLKANHSMDWDTFRKYFCDPGQPDSHKRISTILSYTMKRRTMSTTLLGKPILTLPKPHPFIQYQTFTPQEKIIYRITENRFRTGINTAIREGRASKNYASFMVQLLRLRQCTSHPFLLEDTIRNFWTLEDIEEWKARTNKWRGSTAPLPFYEAARVWVETAEKEREAEFANGASMTTTGTVDGSGNMLPFGKGKFGHAFNMEKVIGTLNSKNMIERVTCGICADMPENPHRTDCGHMFCKDCIQGAMYRQFAESDYTTCPTCDNMFVGLEKVRGLDVDGDEDQESLAGDSQSGPEPSGKRRKTGRSKGSDILGFEPKTKASTWVTRSDNDDAFPMIPSAKTAALKSILLKGFAEAPLDKVVIYVQFRVLARIIGRICREEGWGFLYFTGDASIEHRGRVVKEFQENQEAKILIAGLKCGGLGLNFPWANRCISLDLWWNSAVEQQAFGRIYRIGQMKPTYMTRIVIRDSIDTRLLQMQVSKFNICGKVIVDEDEKAKKATPSLGFEQLATLFGFLKTDGDDKIVSVEADYSDQAEWDEGGAGRIEPDVSEGV